MQLNLNSDAQYDTPKTKLECFSDGEIESRLLSLVATERTSLTEILAHIMEIEDRRIHLKQGIPSLHAYCEKILKYPGDQAYRRITAMRLLRECPKIKEDLDHGNLNMTQLGQAQGLFNAQDKKHEPLTPEAKTNFLGTLVGKSVRDTEQVIAAANPEAIKKDKVRPITAKLTEIKFVASNELVAKLNRFKELDSHSLKNATYAELFEKLVDLAIAQKEKRMGTKQKPAKVKAEEIVTVKFETPVETTSEKSVGNLAQTPFAAQRKVPYSKPSSAKPSRHILIHIKRAVYLRDGGKCTFKNQVTGQACGSRHKIQYDHIFPFALGGEHTLENLTLRCQGHNLLLAERHFGQNKIRARTQ